MSDIAREWQDAAALPRDPADRTNAESHWEHWREAAAASGEEDLRAFARDAEKDPAARALLDAAFAHSPYLSRCLIAEPAFARLLVREGPEAALAMATAEAGPAKVSAGAEAESTEELMTRLRVAKRRVALATGLADIAGAWPLERVTAELSGFAETALGTAFRHLFAARLRAGKLSPPDESEPERGTGLFALGMGKLGARELNYSSDIDLIVLYDQERAEKIVRGEPRPVLTQLTRDLIKIIGERTADGYVFRTDLRLRPDPGSTPVAVTVQAAENYYQRVGRNWERAAMIKARAMAGDVERGEEFLRAIAPFVWRRNLDFLAARDIQSVKRQIDASRQADGESVAGRNVKLGSGGIREIEFFAQAQQLIWGGRAPKLRAPGTLEALEALVAAGHMTGREAARLRDAYEFLRRLEHRLQMVNDEQTHSLPDSEAGVADITAFMGFESPDAFREAFLGHVREVDERFGSLFDERPRVAVEEGLDFSGEEDDAATVEAIGRMGFGAPAGVSGMVRGWLRDLARYPAMRSERANALLAGLAPALLQAFAGSAHPDPALARFDRFLSRLPDGEQLLTLLETHPDLLGLVAEIMGAAPRLADWLTSHPGLLDSVLGRDFTDLALPDDAALDPEMVDSARRGLIRLFYAREFTVAEMSAELSAALERVADRQEALDTTRRWANDRVFQIGVHMLRDLMSPVEAGLPLASIADTCVDALLPMIEAEFAAEHGRVPGGRAAVVAFGKLGSREMTVGSDLDLLFLYDHEEGASGSDGRKPLAPGQYYARLCRRLIGAITAPTGEGKLYDVDMRLRPSGNSGPVASSLDAFARYQRESAWTWEHQALTRARVVFAQDGLGEAFDDVRLSVLTAPRDRGELAAEIRDMRERIRRENPEEGSWAIKHRRGGLVDAEFLAQFLQLSEASGQPGILAGDTISVFEAAAAHGLLDGDAARELADATRLWRNLLGILQLTGEDTLAPGGGDGEDDAGGPAGGKLVFDALLDSMEEAAARVAGHFDALLPEGPPGAPAR